MLKRLMLMLLLCSLLIVPVWAEDVTHAETTTDAVPIGLGQLALLIGVVAILFVGGAIWLREQRDTDDEIV